MEEGDCERALQLIPKPSFSYRPCPISNSPTTDRSDHPPLDLNLSIGVGPLQPTSNEENKGIMRKIHRLKWHAAEQIRLASLEKAYAEQVRQLTRREMELAEKEFARARLVWERAQEEVEKAERMKELTTKCMEVTCQACRQQFRQ